MSIDFDQFKVKMQNDESARATFVASVVDALKSQGVKTDDLAIMKKFGFHPTNNKFDPKKLENLASTVVLTIVM